MELYTHKPYVLKPQSVSYKFPTIARLGKLNRIELTPAFESWIPRTLARFDTAKKPRKRLIQATHGPLSRRVVNPCVIRVDPLLALKPIETIVTGNAGPMALPGHIYKFETFIV
jgi:hypothetical protein